MVVVSLAGCIGGDGPSEQAEINSEQENPLLFREWTDEELIGQVNTNFTQEPSVDLRMEGPLAMVTGDSFVINGTSDRRAALFVFVMGGRDVCGFYHDSFSERMEINGSWTYNVQGITVGYYHASGTAFGMKEDGYLDLTVGTGQTQGIEVMWPVQVRVDWPDDDGLETWNLHLPDRSAYSYYYDPGDDGSRECKEIHPRPKEATVHDAIEFWTMESGILVDWVYDEGQSSFVIDAIDGEDGASVNPLEEDKGWCYLLNDQPVMTGVSQQMIQPGDTINLTLEGC